MVVTERSRNGCVFTVFNVNLGIIFPTDLQLYGCGFYNLLTIFNGRSKAIVPRAPPMPQTFSLVSKNFVIFYYIFFTLFVICARGPSGHGSWTFSVSWNGLVPSCFSCPCCGLWVGFNKLAVHQGKDGRKSKAFARMDRLPIFQCEKEQISGAWVRVWRSDLSITQRFLSLNNWSLYNKPYPSTTGCCSEAFVLVLRLHVRSRIKVRATVYSI